MSVLDHAEGETLDLDISYRNDETGQRIVTSLGAATVVIEVDYEVNPDGHIDLELLLAALPQVIAQVRSTLEAQHG